MQRYRAARDFLRVPVWLIEGTEKNSRAPIVLFFSGQLENKVFLTNILFTGETTEHFRYVWRWRIDRLACDARHPHALAIVERTSWPRSMPTGTFYIPRWIGGNIAFAVAEQQRRTESIKHDLRRIRREGFEYRVERSREAMLRFYDEMYVPYARAVYGLGAFLASRDDFEAVLPRAELNLICRKGEAIAGQITLRNDDNMRAWILGIKDGDREHVRAGAIAALYHFVTRDLAARGHARLQMGGSRAFFTDGVLRFKAKWGLKITDRMPGWFVLRVLQRSEAVNAFLANNPFIFEAQGRFYGAVFLVGREPPPQKPLSMLAIDGLRGLVVFRRATNDGGGWAAAGVIALPQYPH